MFSTSPKEAIRAAIEGFDGPTIFYDNPDMSGGQGLPVSLIEESLATFPNKIIGIKSSTKKFEDFLKILELKSPTFSVLQGHTAYAAQSLRLGASGIVPVESQYRAPLFKMLFNSSKQENWDLAETCSKEVDKLLTDLKRERSEMEGYDAARIVKYHLKRNQIINSDMMFPKAS
jgi:dihydrodipicolinate synthase/N-acetylneuraminate lyase